MGEDVVHMSTHWRSSVVDPVAPDVLEHVVTPDLMVGGRSPAARTAPWPPPPPPRLGTEPRHVDSRRHWLEVVFLLGLAGVFVSNAVVAWIDPASFVKLAQDSRIGAWLGLGDAPWLAPVICVNDFVVGIGVLAAIWWARLPRRLILAWAGIWLLAVTILKLTALDIGS
jgi:hypothetical protein